MRDMLFNGPDKTLLSVTKYQYFFVSFWGFMSIVFNLNEDYFQGIDFIEHFLRNFVPETGIKLKDSDIGILIWNISDSCSMRFKSVECEGFNKCGIPSSSHAFSSMAARCGLALSSRN